MNAFACSLALSAGIAFTGPPPNAERVDTVMQDDAALLYRSPAQVGRSLHRMSRLGVDRVRITASWRQLAPQRDWRTRPFFDATDPSQYERPALERLDHAVRAAHAQGLEVMLDLGFFAPRWAVTRGGRGGRNVWRPDPREFGSFAHAMAERYGGRYPDPARPGRRLPAVRTWTTWNEPNHGVFLRPQWQRVGGRWRPASPLVYRRLHEAGYRAVKDVSRSNRVLIGGLSSFGDRTRGPTRNMAPLRFLRELACVDSALQPLHTPDCRNFRPLRADGFAHHPYSLRTPPGANDEGSDRVQIGELAKLTTLLRRLERLGRIKGSLPLYLTEYGYQSNPPDPGGLAPAQVADYLSQAFYLGWREASVRSFPQFLLYDIGPDRRAPPGSRARWGGYQTGIYTYDGHVKPAVAGAFEMPLVVTARRDDRGTAALAVFGQVRPGSGPQAVTLERLLPDGRWLAVPTDAPGRAEGCEGFATDGQGIYRRTAAYAGPGTYRVVRRTGSGGSAASPAVVVGEPIPTAGGAQAALTRVGTAPADR